MAQIELNKKSSLYIFQFCGKGGPEIEPGLFGAGLWAGEVTGTSILPNNIKSNSTVLVRKCQQTFKSTGVSPTSAVRKDLMSGSISVTYLDPSGSGRRSTAARRCPVDTYR